MPPDRPPGRSAFRSLAHSRTPSSAETRLLTWLAAEVGSELTAQVDTATVVGECACGCSSVELSTSAPPLPGTTISRLSVTGRSDYLKVSSTGHSREGHMLEVALHVAQGRLRELEVFDIDAGEGVAVDLAGVARLSRPEVG